MAGRPRIYETTALIGKAIDVFWSKGYEAASAGDLLEALGIGQGSFYLNFKKGKRELFEKALIRFTENGMKQFDEGWRRAAEPLAYLREFFLAIPGFSRERKRKGCFLGNTIAELGNTDPPMKNLAVKLLSQLEDRFRMIIGQAQQDGLLKNDTDPAVLARHLLNLWNGINITQRLRPDDATNRTVIEMNLELLK